MTKPCPKLATASASDRELKNFSRKHIYMGSLFLLSLFLGVGLLGLFFEDQILAFTQSVANYFGFWGLAALVFVCDSILSPLPPDLVLLIIAKSGLRENWPFYVLIISLVSTIAGHLAYWIGRFFITFNWLPSFLGDAPIKQKDNVKKYGHWAVILGTCTPLPFSFTCWTAGFLKMKYSTFSLASTARIPRIFIYYLAIHYSDIFRHLLF